MISEQYEMLDEDEILDETIIEATEDLYTEEDEEDEEDADEENTEPEEDLSLDYEKLFRKDLKLKEPDRGFYYYSGKDLEDLHIKVIQKFNKNCYVCLIKENGKLKKICF